MKLKDAVLNKSVTEDGIVILPKKAIKLNPSVADQIITIKDRVDAPNNDVTVHRLAEIISDILKGEFEPQNSI